MLRASSIFACDHVDRITSPTRPNVIPVLLLRFKFNLSLRIFHVAARTCHLNVIDTPTAGLLRASTAPSAFTSGYVQPSRSPSCCKSSLVSTACLGCQSVLKFTSQPWTRQEPGPCPDGSRAWALLIVLNISNWNPPVKQGLASCPV